MRLLVSAAALCALALSCPQASAADTPQLTARYNNYVLCMAYATRLGEMMKANDNSQGEQIADNAFNHFKASADVLASSRGLKSDALATDYTKIQHAIDSKLLALSETGQAEFSGQLDGLCTKALEGGDMPDVAFVPLFG